MFKNQRDSKIWPIDRKPRWTLPSQYLPNKSITLSSVSRLGTDYIDLYHVFEDANHNGVVQGDIQINISVLLIQLYFIVGTPVSLFWLSISGITQVRYNCNANGAYSASFFNE